MKPYTVILHAVLLSAALAEAAQAADPIPAGARLAATCTGCHGTNGANGATRGNALPPLAGQPKERLLATLKDFKAGKQQATIMTQLIKGYTDEQLEALSAYFASQKKIE